MTDRDRPPNLDTLPSHIHSQIASYVDQLTIWRMMSVCRAVRAGAETALRPHLEREVLVVWRKPADCTQSGVTADDRTYRDSLRQLSEGLSRHFAAYPPSFTLLRQFRVELRDDCDYSGWVHLRNLAPQLVQLDIYFLDKLWTIANSLQRADPGLSDFMVRRQAAGSQAVWARVLDYNDIKFPLLVDLHLRTSARLIHHFAALAASLPALRNLSLTCHFYEHGLDEDVGEGSIEAGDALAAAIPAFPHLERLAMMCDTNAMGGVTSYILPKAPNLRFLTVSISDWPRNELDPSNLSAVTTMIILQVMLSKISTSPRLNGLALYGACCHDSLGVIRDLQRDGAEENPGFATLTSLVLERGDVEEAGHRRNPLLYDEIDDRPVFPSLRSVTYVNEPPKSTKPHATDPFFRDSINHYAVESLFDQYPTLESIRWLVGFPEDAFAEDVSDDALIDVIHRDDPFYADHIAWKRDLLGLPQEE